jgi:hypothetical protein
MSNYVCFAVLLLVAALAPCAASAALIFSDMRFFASTAADPGGLSDDDAENVPNNVGGDVNALTRAAGDPFPNLPNSVGSAFASATILTFGGGTILSGVGTNGFFLRNALPPNLLFARATISQTITNDSTTDTESVLANFVVPTPIMQFFGVGDFFPVGADPARDATALVTASLFTDLTRADGSDGGRDFVFNYDMVTLRDPQTGKFGLDPQFSEPEATRFDAPDGSFGFRLPEFEGEDVPLPAIGPGEVLEVFYDFLVQSTTGFGETGIFAAIGDPFDLSGSGARFELQAGDVISPPPPGVSEPNALAVLGLGLVMLVRAARRRF